MKVFWAIIGLLLIGAVATLLLTDRGLSSPKAMPIAGPAATTPSPNEPLPEPGLKNPAKDTRVAVKPEPAANSKTEETPEAKPENSPEIKPEAWPAIAPEAKPATLSPWPRPLPTNPPCPNPAHHPGPNPAAQRAKARRVPGALG